MSYNKILIEETEGTKKIILNRPEKRNSLDEEMIFELTDAFRKYSDDEETRSIILTGAGGNFCSGLYLDYLQKISEYDILQNKMDSQKFKNLLLSIYNCRKPVIAMVDCYALAGGCGIASVCDFIVASDKAQIGYTEVKIGFIPAIVMIFLLKRVSETHAKDLLLTSKFISGEEAHRIGFVNYVTSQTELENFTMNLSNDLNKLPMSSLSLTKEMFKNISSMSFEASLEYAVNLNAITRMTEECKHGVMNFLNSTKKVKS
ncbi:MAG: enoyl-CoA hydratase/isomerase family protein [Ignavibacteria bacterium]|nr:enoyl-CoA hydratase/isomerase family protein [Ignavibacteria bacterium]